MYAAAAVLVPALLGRCQIKGQRQANDPHIVVFEDGNPINRSRGVETQEAMPSTGNLYVHSFDKENDLNMLCYSGSPIGTFYEKNCCDSGTDCDFITVDNHLFSDLRSFHEFVMDNKNLTAKVFTTAVECNKATAPGRITRTAAERSAPNPEAAPYEFVSRADDSACDCRGATPQFNSENYAVASTYAHQWASTLRDMEGGPNLLPSIDSFGACNFFESGYGWSDDQESGVMTPIIPKRDLAPQQRLKINASGYRVPVFEGQKTPTMPCDGNPQLSEDVNYCFFETEMLEPRVIRPGDERKLSIFCSSQGQSPDLGNSRFLRCCMKLEVSETGGNAVSGFVIRADVLMAAGCASVMRAPNNGDGAFHYFPDYNKEPDALFAKTDAGYTETQLQPGLFVDPELRRLRSDLTGFNQVCVPIRENIEAPTCSRFRGIDVGKNGIIDDDDLASLEDTEFDLATNTGAGSDYNARVKTILDESTDVFIEESRLFYKSCLLPKTDSFGNPIKTKACDAVGLFSTQPYLYDSNCSADDTPPYIQGWAQANGIAVENAIKEWSKMTPARYSASGSVPLNPADSLTNEDEHCFPNAEARTAPKDRQKITPLSGIDNYECKPNCCLGQPDVKSDGCADQCSMYLRPLELIRKNDGRPFDKDDWQKLYEACKTKDDQNENFCKYAGQLYVDRPIFKRDDEELLVYDRNGDETPYCEGRSDGAIVSDSTNIFFIGAGPRTRGIEHPMWEAGGYIGGSFESPAYMKENSSDSFPLMNNTQQRADSTVTMVAPNGNVLGVLSASSSLGGQPIVETVLGAIMADPSCYMENHRGSRVEQNIAIPGLYPRYLDLITGGNTECAADISSDGSGNGFWTPSAVGHQDLYLRGGGRAEDGTVDDDYGGSMFYYNYNGKNYGIRPKLGVCVAPEANGCAGYCDAAAEAGSIAGTVFESIAGVLLTAVVTVLTDGVGDAALVAVDAGTAAAEAGTVAAEGAVEGAAEGAAEAGLTDAAAATGDIAETNLDEAAAAAEEEGAATAAEAESSVASRAASAAKNGVTRTARGLKGIAKSSLKQIRGHPIRTLLGSVLIADSIGKITSGTTSPSADAAGAVTAFKHWRSILKAGIKSSVHPIARYDTIDVDKTYDSIPSMIFTCIDGEDKCFRSPGQKVNGKFGQDDDDWWKYMPGMLPTQTFASQMGCHTIFEGNGDFKQNMAGFSATVFNTSISQRQTKFPRVTFMTIPASAIRKYTDGSLYHSGTKNSTYRPFVEERYHKCSLCALYSGYAENTPSVSECIMPLPPDLRKRRMRYRIKDTSVYDFSAVDLLKNVTWGNVSTVEMTFYQGGIQKKTFSKSNGNTNEAQLVQRLLGRNLTHPDNRLTNPGCLGDTSSMTSMCGFDNSLRVKPTQAVECVDNTSTFNGACINPIWASILSFLRSCHTGRLTHTHPLTHLPPLGQRRAHHFSKQFRL